MRSLVLAKGNYEYFLTRNPDNTVEFKIEYAHMWTHKRDRCDVFDSMLDFVKAEPEYAARFLMRAFK